MKKFLPAVVIGLMLSGCAGLQAHRISQDEARVVLTAFVNQEFGRKTLAEAYLPRKEGQLAWPRLAQQDLRFVELAKGRWVASTEQQPAGFYVRASVDEFGSTPQLEAVMFYFP